MKILLDQNISYLVVGLLAAFFEKVDHVKALKLTDASDKEIWDFARRKGYTIITFDSDFIEIATLRGTPPKIVWLRFDNSSNLKIANKLLLNAEAIKGFINDTDSGIGLLEID